MDFGKLQFTMSNYDSQEITSIPNFVKTGQEVQNKLNALLTVHHSISVQWNQRDKLCIQFIENQEPLHISSISCSSSGGAAQTALGILRAVPLQSCHSQLTLYARNTLNAVCGAPPEDEQAMLETCRGLWFSKNWMKIASRWFHCTDIGERCVCLCVCLR
jgi:hypothetical protein